MTAATISWGATSHPHVHFGLGDGTFEPAVVVEDLGKRSIVLPDRSPGDANLNGIAYAACWGTLETDSCGVSVLSADPMRQLATPWSTDEPHFSALAVGDFLADGRGAVAAAGGESELRIHVLCGEEDGTYETCDTIDLPVGLSVMNALDLNDDGIEDLIFMNGSEPDRLYVLYAKP